MNRRIAYTTVAVMFSVSAVVTASAGGPTSSSQGSQGQQSTRQGGDARSSSSPHETAQTGDQELAKTQTEVIKGQLVGIDDEYYVIQAAAGKQVRVHVDKSTDTESPGAFNPGDWIEARVSSDNHAKSLRKSSAARTVEGDLLKIEEGFYVVKDSAGAEVRLQLGKDTKIDGKPKVGDRVRAQVTTEGTVTSIQPAPIQQGTPAS